ncbi:hypothetical protein NOF04DRAFT_16818 [Fusarium oxysporum II5]|uniref:Peptidase S1 domain-containing protein n=2 Tax=Fusarium oxysporum species complex TaxID=171631 RepID=X0JVN3_FUSO5|nr:uncharacterized protein FOIG_03938 [Fusarium odoratissimum NRRL 54006]EXM05334.1 hypothetical protein FOIG_03938 [Fusarium odoratissimum NRRL 54006]KAK2126269.1 hypothetical protein NOF04DRAFT_16818 [Fusarium oxysporum II5]TXB99397.1 hypothetical protein FocTR4_00014488 [Fusarium oxysporum f. sp. cubense]
MDPSKLVHVGWKRVAWPELRIQRLESSRERRLPSSVEKLRTDIRNHAYTLLKKHNLFYRDENGDENEVLLEMLQHPLEPDTAQPTIIMLARWSPANAVAFRNVAQEMVDWLADWATNVSQRINVEITAPENVQTIYYGAVGDRALSNAWDSTREAVDNLLESLPSTKGSLTCLALQKYGVNPEINANPPTVYMSMDHRSNEATWNYVATRVKELLNKQGWNHVQVHIEHNLNMFCTFPLLPITDDKAARMENGYRNSKRITGDYRNTVQIGDDIGAARYTTREEDERSRDPGAGTLGCFVQIKTTNHQEWRTMILTNYHVVRPAFDGFKLKTVGSESVAAAPDNDSDLWYVDVHGYSPHNKHNLKGRVCSMESPSRTKHNFTITSIDDTIATLKEQAKFWQQTFNSTKDERHERNLRGLKSRIAALKVERREKVTFFDGDKHFAGRIFLCPGFLRKSKGRRMDWALIHLDKSRSWSNRLPDMDDWKSLQDEDKPYRTYDMPITDPLHSLEERTSLGHVYKVGAVTGATTGDCHDEQENVKLVDDVHLGQDERSKTTELIIKPGGPGKFCSHGDSGSVVFDSDGGIVGLFFRGHKHNGSFDDGYGYATPIELVFQDIKDFSEQGVTDIRIAKA